MSLGVIVQNRTAPSSRGVPTDTGEAYVIGAAGAGTTTTYTTVRSLADFATQYNPREVANELLYDWLDVFFREGGQVAHVVRYTPGAANMAAALALFPRALGAGQVAAPAEPMTAITMGHLLTHCAANNRVALFDVGNGDSVAAMTTLGGLIPSANESYGAMFGPWVNVPAPAGVIGGSVRTVPISAVIAALCQRVDSDGNPNRAAAGRDYPFQYVTSMAGPDISDAQREALLNAGVNTAGLIYGVLENYGFQTGVTQSEETSFWQFNVSRARMWLTAHCQALGEGFMFKPIDGRGLLAGALKRAIMGKALELYNVDGLFGATPEEAFAVEVGAHVNTVNTVAQGELRAVGEFVFSLHAKAIVIDLVSVPVKGKVTQAS